MSNIKYFIIVLVISTVVALAIASTSSSEDAFPLGLFIAFFLSLYLTLFRILKKSNDSDHRLGFWKYFFVLALFVSGILALVILLITQEESTVPASVIAGVIISFIIASIRGMKFRKQERSAKQERERLSNELLQRQTQKYADELKKKDRIIEDLRNRNSELSKNQQSSRSSSFAQSSSYNYDRYQEEQMERQREQMRRQEEEDRKQQRLDDWYREYVTIEVEFDYHIKDSEYNQDYWDYRDEEIRVSRREAMALIEAGDSAIFGKLGYGNWGLIRNFRYKVPYRLYDRPWGC